MQMSKWCWATVKPIETGPRAHAAQLIIQTYIIHFEYYIQEQENAEQKIDINTVLKSSLRKYTHIYYDIYGVNIECFLDDR